MIRDDTDPSARAIRQQACLIHLDKNTKTRIQKGRCAMTSANLASAKMARAELGDLPRKNPCAQCGRPISMPEWIEAGPRRTSYLWHCYACDYRFEAVAFFDGSQPDQQPLAA
jgi:hypothetical protein